MQDNKKNSNSDQHQKFQSVILGKFDCQTILDRLAVEHLNSILLEGQSDQIEPTEQKLTLF